MDSYVFPHAIVNMGVARWYWAISDITMAITYMLPWEISSIVSHAIHYTLYPPTKFNVFSGNEAQEKLGHHENQLLF